MALPWTCDAADAALAISWVPGLSYLAASCGEHLPQTAPGPSRACVLHKGASTNSLRSSFRARTRLAQGTAAQQHTQTATMQTSISSTTVPRGGAFRPARASRNTRRARLVGRAAAKDPQEAGSAACSAAAAALASAYVLVSMLACLVRQCCQVARPGTVPAAPAPSATSGLLHQGIPCCIMPLDTYHALPMVGRSHL